MNATPLPVVSTMYCFELVPPFGNTSVRPACAAMLRKTGAYVAAVTNARTGTNSKEGERLTAQAAFRQASSGIQRTRPRVAFEADLVSLFQPLLCPYHRNCDRR